MTTIHEQVVAFYGPEKQKLKLVEECAELIHAITRELIGKKGSTCVEEEIADVQFVLDQMKYIYDRNLIDDWAAIKRRRVEGKLKG